jgi:hypothetical protein
MMTDHDPMAEHESALRYLAATAGRLGVPAQDLVDWARRWAHGPGNGMALAYLVEMIRDGWLIVHWEDGEGRLEVTPTGKAAFANW